MISEAEINPFRVRYRLVGTRVAAITGFDFTGRYLDEVLSGGSSEPWIDYYAAIHRTRAPLLGCVTEPATSGGKFSYEFAIVPVSAGGDDVQQFIAVEDYFGFNLTSAGLRPWPPRS